MSKTIKISIAFILILNFLSLSAQNPGERSLWRNTDIRDFATIQQRMSAYFETNPHGKHSGYKQWKRWEYETQFRLSPNGEIVNHSALNWKANTRIKETSPTMRALVNGATWNQLAPLAHILTFLYIY